MESNELGIVVAVGPDGVEEGTLRLAASEARSRGTGVELLHVVHSRVAPTSPEQVAALDQALLEVGRAVLTDGAARLRPLLDGQVPLTTELRNGPVVDTILECTAGRDVIILERRHADRLLTMSVSSRVAARASDPVVVVPHGWSCPMSDLPVTVGVDTPVDVRGQVETAAAYAASSGRDLRVLFAMWIAEPYQSTVLVNHTRRQWKSEAAGELRRSLKELDPDAVLTADVQWARPVDALVAASRRSAMVVLSRRPVHGRMGVHLGPISRSVLRHAECPVMVVDRT